MKYVYHLGVHKTASSYLQNVLKQNLSVLRDQGVYFVNEERPTAMLRQRKIVRKLCNPERTPPQGNELLETNLAVYDAAREAGAKTILFSEENRIGPPMQQELAWGVDKPGFYSNAKDCLRHLTVGFPLRRTRFLIYSRDPVSYILSLYSECIRAGTLNMTLDQFCKSVDLDSIDFADLAQRLQSLHPKLDIRTTPYETVAAGAESFAKNFLRDIGLDPTPFEINPRPVRPRLDAIQVEALLHISQNASDDKWRQIKRQRNKVLSYAPDPNHPLQLPEWVAERFAGAVDSEQTPDTPSTVALRQAV